MTAIYLPTNILYTRSFCFYLHETSPPYCLDFFFTALLLQTTQNVLEQWGNFFGDLKCLDVIEDVI